MTIVLTTSLMASIYPKAPLSIRDAFVRNQGVLSEILETPQRVALAFANCSAEVAGFALPNLTEEIFKYTHANIAKLWPSRFPGGVEEVKRRFGNASGWQRNAFDDIYGSKTNKNERMGNRPGTRDGSTFIGRGGPQITGRDGYIAAGDRMGVDLVNNPTVATQPDRQPDLLAAFWDWKGLSRFADRGDVVGARKVWNGGTNGLATVQSEYARILKILKAPATAAVNVQAPKATKDPVLEGYQQKLIDMGYYTVGDADGLIGGKTKGAIKDFNTDRGYKLPSEATQAVYDGIDEAWNEEPRWHKPVAPSRAYVQAPDIIEKVASVKPTQDAGFWTKVQGWFVGGTTVVGGAVKLLPDANDQASPYISLVQQFFPSVPTLVFFAVVAVIAFVTYRKITAAQQATVADYQTGKIN